MSGKWTRCSAWSCSFFQLGPSACAELKGLAADSLALLRAALYDARFPALFELELYGAIVGIFELNNLGKLAETSGCFLALRLLLQAVAGSCLHDIAPCSFSSGMRPSAWQGSLWSRQ